MSRLERFLIVALILPAAACGSSKDAPEPTPAPTETPAPSPAPSPTPAINLACGDDLSGLRIQAAGETFLASFNREFAESQSMVEAVRFTQGGEVLDTPPLTIFGGDGPLRPDYRVTDLAGLDSEFVIQIFGTTTSDLGVSQQEVHTRTLATTGPLTSEAQNVISQVGIGTCRTFPGGRNAVTYDLAGSAPHSAIQWSAACAGQGILLQWIDGLPWDSTIDLNANSTSEGWPALARSSNAVGGVFASAPTVPNNASLRVLRAGWIETPVPDKENRRETLTALAERTSARPGLATLGETFLAAWGSGPDADSDLTELRILRFTARDGALDPDGGLLLTEADGIRAPVVSSNGSEFLVAWAEPDEDSDGWSETLFLHRIGADGTLVAEEPSVVTSITAGTAFDLASNDTTVAVAYYSRDDAGQDCLRISRP